MDDLILDVKRLIINQIKYITTVRQLSRTSKSWYSLCREPILRLEKIYCDQYKGLEFTAFLKEYSKEKFTIELILDDEKHLMPTYYRQNNNMLYPLFAFKGDMDEFKNVNKSDICNYTFSCCAYNGHLELFKLIKHDGLNLKYDLCFNASVYPHDHFLDYLRENNLINMEAIVSNICRYNHVHLLYWIHKHNLFFSSSLINMIIKYNGNTNLFNVFIDLHPHNLDNSHFNECIRENYVDGVQWCHDHHLIPDEDAWHHAIRLDYIDIVKWAIQHDYIHMNQLKVGWLFNNKCKNIIKFVFKTQSDQEILPWFEHVLKLNMFKLVKLYHKRNLIPKQSIDLKTYIFSHSFIKYLYHENLLLIHYDNYVNLYILNIINLHTLIDHVRVDNGYHIQISNGNITRIKFSETSTQQKLIIYHDNGHISIDSCTNHHTCLLLFYLLSDYQCRENFEDIKKQLSTCPKHSKYVI
ncbi:MAG TPA: hypothetical protein VLG50_05285 [Candidatus Saccharimonadales bacterium]|nr:hypothetical protein [Candidatus Saccharimonadales bacterium]